jgi:uncharacterized protein (TIGR03663 family)
MFFLFGPSTATSRYLAALFGVLMLLLTWLMRPFLGKSGALAAAALMAFSPTFMYFCRFCREDAYVAGGTLALVVFLYRYIRFQKTWDLLLASLGFAIAYCSKESIFLTVFIFGVYLFFRLILFAIEASEGIEGPPSDLKIFFRGLRLSKFMGDLALAVALFAVIYILLFTTFFQVGKGLPPLERVPSILKSLWDGLFGGLAYWWSQHGVHRGDQPFYYYFLQLLANEPLGLLFSTIAVVYYILQSFWDRVRIMPMFLVFWFLGSFLLFTFAGERMPWLTLHIALPALLLAGYFVGEIWESRPKVEFTKFARWGAHAVFALLLFFSCYDALRLSFRNAADPVESYVYVQSSPDCLEVEKIVRKISTGETGGSNMMLIIQDSCSWPFAWLFHDFKNRSHPVFVDSTKDPILLTATESDDREYPLLSQAGYVNNKYKLRCWWVSSWFKKGYPAQSMSPALFLDWLFSNGIPFLGHKDDMVGWKELTAWFFRREVWSDEGSYNMRLWVRGDLAQKYGFVDIHRQDIPSQYP